MGLRNLLLLRVTLPEPSILILCWSRGRVAIMVPDLSHLGVCVPDWFCTTTTSEIFRPWSTLVWFVSLSSYMACLLVSAISLLSLVRSHSFRLGLIERNSLIGCPKII
jgi:hypothetical protein